MTTLMFQPRFVEPIQSGRKRQTIRPPRKRPIKIGERLSLRVWKSKAYRSPQIEFATGKAVATLPIEITEDGIRFGIGELIKERRRLDAFAVSDGFECWPHMRDFLRSRFDYGLPFTGVLIQWEDSKP